jgi:phage replication O-like protein O
MNIPDQDDDPPPSRAEHLLHVAAIVQTELWRFDLNKRHLQIISVLLNLSLGWGNETVKIKNLQTISDLTGLWPTNVSATINELCLMRIVSERQVGDLIEYRIDPDSDHWKCQPRQSAEKLVDTLHLVKMLNRKPSEEN